MDPGTGSSGEPELLGDTPVRLPRDRREPEVLDTAPRDLWHPPLWLLALTVLVVAAGALAWYTDGRARTHETRALEECRQELHAAVISADLEMLSVAANLRPALASAAGPERTRTAGLMAVPARRLLPDVVRADRLCRSVSVRPWHRSLKAQRDAATAYSGALVAKLGAVAADGSDYYRDNQALRQLRRAAEIGVFGGRY